MKGGFYHDGRFATLLDVVNHYDNHFHLGLSNPEKADLVEFLKSNILLKPLNLNQLTKDRENNTPHATPFDP